MKQIHDSVIAGKENACKNWNLSYQRF